MVELGDIKTGTQVTIQLENDREENPFFELSTKFETAHDGEYFSIAAPIWQGQYYVIMPSDILRVMFFYGGIRQVCEARLVGEYERGSLLFLKLKRTSPILEIQLRDDFRLPVTDEAKIIFSETENGEPVERTRFVRLKDLSGGGARFITTWNPARLTKIKMELHIGSSAVQMDAEVQRIEVLIGSSGLFDYTVGVKFLFDSEQEKERIVRHVFKLQSKMIQAQGGRKDLQ